MRRRTGKNAVEISLFPFLAVLICTMGALIVLFVVMVLQARTDADTPTLAIPAPEPVAQPTPPSGPPRAEVEAQIRELEELRQQGQTRLEESRLRLSGLEDHIQRVLGELRQLKGQIEILEAERKNPSGMVEEVEEKIRKTQKKIEEAEARLEKLREDLKGRKPAYALVPYEGRNGTQRQPIYIECTETAVIIQPEGVYLNGNDFGPPLGPGNPLAAALRIIREYRAEQAGGLAANPYPLLIVRPGGTESYAAAREALKSWDADFGYELVEDDMELAYPTADPFLARQLVEVVEFARRRKIALIEAAPRKYGRIENNPGLVASRNGGFQPAGGGGGRDSGGEGTGDSPFGENRFVRGGLGESGSGSQLPGIPGGGEGTAEFAHQSPGAGGGPGEQGPGFDSGGTTSTGGRSEDGLGGLGPHLAGPDGKPGESTAGNGGDRQSGTFAAGQQGAAEAEGGNDWRVSDQDPTQTGGRGSSNTTFQSASPNSTANGSETSQQAGQQRGQAKPSPAQGGQPGAASSAGSAGGAGGTGGTGKSNDPLAAQRGANWAVKQADARSTGITRPVAIQCSADQLLLQAEPGSRLPARIIELGPDPVGGVDQLVKLVDARIEGWASAGRGLHWKPVLHVQVLPGGEARFAQLQRLLQGSGMEVIRK